MRVLLLGVSALLWACVSLSCESGVNLRFENKTAETVSFSVERPRAPFSFQLEPGAHIVYSLILGNDEVLPVRAFRPDGTRIYSESKTVAEWKRSGAKVVIEPPP
jgi:hypothetical protein